MIPPLGTCLEKAVPQKDTRTPTFTAALFTTARMWKQPKHLLTDTWVKIWYIQTMEYQSAIKKNGIVSFVEMWMDLKSVIQSEVNQKQKHKYCTYYGIQKNGTDKPICKAGKEMQTQTTDVCTRWGTEKAGGMNREIEPDIYTPSCR